MGHARSYPRHVPILSNMEQNGGHYEEHESKEGVYCYLRCASNTVIRYFYFTVSNKASAIVVPSTGAVAAKPPITAVAPVSYTL